jgi:hypothetical protein
MSVLNGLSHTGQWNLCGGGVLSWNGTSFSSCILFFFAPLLTPFFYNKKNFVISYNLNRPTIDLVLIDPQSAGKRTHDLMDTMRKRDGKPFAGVSINI